jgi:hypothetical protein
MDNIIGRFIIVNSLLNTGYSICTHSHCHPLNGGTPLIYLVTGRPQGRAPTKKNNIAGGDVGDRPCGRAGLLSCLIVPLTMMVVLQKSSFPKYR